MAATNGHQISASHKEAILGWKGAANRRRRFVLSTRSISYRRGVSGPLCPLLRHADPHPVLLWGGDGDRLRLYRLGAQAGSRSPTRPPSSPHRLRRPDAERPSRWWWWGAEVGRYHSLTAATVTDDLPNAGAAGLRGGGDPTASDTPNLDSTGPPKGYFQSGTSRHLGVSFNRSL
jgi:hypothetical protein